jgi:hypothetical protein
MKMYFLAGEKGPELSYQWINLLRLKKAMKIIIFNILSVRGAH